jgi:aconitate hydratase
MKEEAKNDWPIKVEGLIGSYQLIYEDMLKAAVQKTWPQTKQKPQRYNNPAVNNSDIQSKEIEDCCVLKNVDYGKMLMDHVLTMWIEQPKRRKKYCILFNRNLNEQMEPNTLAFVTSPEMVTALAIAGD